MVHILGNAAGSCINIPSIGRMLPMRPTGPLSYLKLALREPSKVATAIAAAICANCMVSDMPAQVTHHCAGQCIKRWDFCH
mmetsp:Transcript_35587/g.70355  ORF Transcript_35587/g.70355 Transcript_35587/m.70355 type:complete len:81 (-) Transcript_35587:233-475(-)